MPDQREKKEPLDRMHVNVDDSEVRYWARTFGVSKDALTVAVKKVGNHVYAVRRKLSETTL